MKRTTRQTVTAWAGFGLILLVGGCVAGKYEPSDLATSTAVGLSPSVLRSTTPSSADLTATAEASVATPATETPDPGPADEHTSLAEVDSVTDGDTIRVFIDDYSTPIRLLGIDTPETVNVNPDECYGAEASAKVHDLLDGTAVILTADPSQQNEDRYHRLLRYVTAGDTGEDVGAFLLRHGYAKYVEFDGPLERSDIYRAAQDEAKTNHVGGWAECGW